MNECSDEPPEKPQSGHHETKTNQDKCAGLLPRPSYITTTGVFWHVINFRTIFTLQALQWFWEINQLFFHLECACKCTRLGQGASRTLRFTCAVINGHFWFICTVIDFSGSLSLRLRCFINVVIIAPRWWVREFKINLFLIHGAFGLMINCMLLRTLIAGDSFFTSPLLFSYGQSKKRHPCSYKRYKAMSLSIKQMLLYGIDPLCIQSCDWFSNHSYLQPRDKLWNQFALALNKTVY